MVSESRIRFLSDTRILDPRASISVSKNRLPGYASKPFQLCAKPFLNDMPGKDSYGDTRIREIQILMQSDNFQTNSGNGTGCVATSEAGFRTNAMGRFPAGSKRRSKAA
jgi:hypothetical protein